MDMLHVFLVLLFGVIPNSHGQSFGSVFEVAVREGDTTPLYCDCKSSDGKPIVWNRKCSHENQPSLLFKIQRGSVRTNINTLYSPVVFPRFEFVKNHSSDSYNLLIRNITKSDEGLYYCATEELIVEDEKCISFRYNYTYSNVATRIVFNSSELHYVETERDCSVCWMLLYSLCAASAVLSSFLSSVAVYCLCSKKAKEAEVDQQKPETNEIRMERNPTRLKQDQDVCYAALEIHQRSQRPKKKSQSSDFSTYSAINTSRM